jgi:hypothetical protein
VSGPHDFSVRFGTVRYRRFHVHRIPSRVRDDREPPLCGTGRLEYASDLLFLKIRIFFRNGLDKRISQAQRTSLICPSGNFRSRCLLIRQTTCCLNAVIQQEDWLTYRSRAAIESE